ncbi:ubiquitin-binding protein cue5 [Podospora pseudoanserina]|uniref:Ubiquitin-binding protein cue5 n=1 Tax=Podospora pseudoanserina TaxID=2609844 RepID=A0ABR0IFE9_9PEZI|nr:ubiquitin-binding protein cue5 [Podospora pseudoanserina]
MSAPTDANKVPPQPESPTTARPLEMDDDDIQEAGIINNDDNTTTTTRNVTTTSASAASPVGEVPPPQPPRPAVNETQQNQQMLKEAFPTIDMAVIKAVLTASRGQIEPAFNALLEMTDPDAVAQNEQPPPQPPRPVAAAHGPTTTAQEQLEADERYARQLAEHFENVGAYEARTANRGGERGGNPGRGGGPVPRGRQQTGLRPSQDEREHSFLDDDLPVIKEQLKKGFLETQTKVNTWFTDFKKKIDEHFDEQEEERRRAEGSAGSSSNPLAGGRPTRDQNQTRRSADYDRYDADPELLSDDFAGMKFHSDGTPVQNQRQFGSNANVFRPPPPSKSPRSHEGRKVAFSDKVEDIDAYNASPKVKAQDAAAAPGGSKPSKWQPLSAVEPNPIVDNDPFSLGDSEDEREVKDKKEIKLEDSERLRQATADAMADSLVDDKTKAGSGSK